MLINLIILDVMKKIFTESFKKGLSMGAGLFAALFVAAGVAYAATTLSAGSVELNDGLSQAEMQIVLDSISDLQNSSTGLSVSELSCRVIYAPYNDGGYGVNYNNTFQTCSVDASPYDFCTGFNGHYQGSDWHMEYTFYGYGSGLASNEDGTTYTQNGDSLMYKDLIATCYTIR